MTKPGRPTKLTDEVQERIVEALLLGATYEHAAAYGGVSYDAFNNWRKRGKAEIERRENPRVKPGSVLWKEEQSFVEFIKAVKKAEGEALVGWLRAIEDAANDGTWQAAAWKAERRYPQDYGRRVHEVTGKDGGPIVSIYLPALSENPADEDGES